MEILRRSPMLAVLTALTAGSALYERLGTSAFFAAVIIVFTAVTFLSYEHELPNQWKFFLFTLFFTVICSLRIYSVISSEPPKFSPFKNETGTVSEIRTWGNLYAVTIDTEHHGKCVTFSHFAEYTGGTRLKFDGTPRAFRPKKDDSNFDEGKFWRARGVNFIVYPRNVQELSARFSLSSLRNYLSRKLVIYTPELTSSYLRSAWLGQRDKNLNDKHKNWGTVHLLAVSGFHVGVVMMCALFFVGKNPVVLSLILWCYVFLTGAAASAVRAGLMIQIILLGKIWGRKDEPVNSVGCAGVMMLLWSPFMFWDIGWRLSIISALTISAMYPRAGSWPIVSPAVAIVTAPQISFIFGGVPAVGFLLNMFAAYYFSFAFTIASASAVLRMMNFPLSRYFVIASEGIFILWEKTADTFAGLLPQVLAWSYSRAWLGCGVMVFFVCDYLKLAPLRKAVVIAVTGLFAFAVFM